MAVPCTDGAPVRAGPAGAASTKGSAPAEAGPPTAAAVPRGPLDLLPLLPKRKRSKPADGMERVSTLAAFFVECDCRSTAKPAPPAAGAAGAPAPAVRCSYYDPDGPTGHQQLLSFLDAPAVLRFNKYIRSGYRAGLTYRQCCASVLSMHNETGNIWTHLLPMLLLLALLAGGQLQAWQGARVAFLANVGSIAACFLGSVLFHTCMAHHHHYEQWLKLDVCGILLVLVGGGHMVLWWGMYCHPNVRLFFALLYYGTGAICVRAALTAKTATGRGVPMLALLVVRLAAFVTRGVLEPHSQALQHYAAMEVCSLAGGLLNVLRIPERWLQPANPSKAAPLDYFFNSHQIMHVLVAVAMWQLHMGATADLHTVSALLEGTAHCPS